MRLLSRLRYPEKSFEEGMVQYALERCVPHDWDVGHRPQAFTVSLTSQPDSLEQWRAYCPRSGGVALGFSAAHLDLVAADQRYLLAPCEYDESAQLRIVGQVVAHHLRIWNDRQPLETRRQGISSHLVHDLITDLDRFAPLLKHPSFIAEQEWRLISTPAGEDDINDYVHIGSETAIKLFRRFELLTEQHPTIASLAGDDDEVHIPWDARNGFRVTVGPNRDKAGMSHAVRTLVPEEFGWIWDVQYTTTLYR